MVTGAGVMEAWSRFDRRRSVRVVCSRRTHRPVERKVGAPSATNCQQGARRLNVVGVVRVNS